MQFFIKIRRKYQRTAFPTCISIFVHNLPCYIKEKKHIKVLFVLITKLRSKKYKIQFVVQ